MNAPRISLCLWLAAPGAAAFEAPPQKCALVKVAEGVYTVIQTKTLEQPLEGNSTILVNDEDVVVIDSQQTPTAARATIAEIRKLTPKPVRTLINTHWHNDHHQGNFVYQEAFPGLEIIAHRKTAEDMATLAVQTLTGRIRGFEDRPRFQQLLDKGVDGEGKPLPEGVKHRLRQRLAVPPEHLKELQEVRLVQPTRTYEDRLILNRGDRSVELFSHGPGNTRSDTVIWLARERIVITGDLLVGTVPFMSESRPRHWLARLKEIAALNPAVIIPGHGSVQRDRQYLDRHIALLESLIAQVGEAVGLGLSLEETRKRVNLDAFRDPYANGDQAVSREFAFRVTEPAVADAYREAMEDSEARQKPSLEGRGPDLKHKSGMVFVHIPAGEFTMGSDTGPEDQRPAHRVRISRPFYLGKHEVTVGQFRQFVEATGYVTVAETQGWGNKWTGTEFTQASVTWRDPGFPQTDEHPVVMVTYKDAVAFAEWLGARLPTEAEWEYAARAGSAGEFTGDLNAVAWHKGSLKPEDRTNIVGQKAANAWGLHDMFGNVWERVSDWYDKAYYQASPAQDPEGPSTGELKGNRGGGWFSQGRADWFSFRGWGGAQNRDPILGFRVVLKGN